MPNRYERFVGTLVCGCIGDMLGSANEGKTYDEIKKAGYIITWSRPVYTDDTEMTIMVARCLVKQHEGPQEAVFDVDEAVLRNSVPSTFAKEDVSANISGTSNERSNERVNLKQKSLMEEAHQMYRDVIKTSRRGYSKQTRDILSNWTPFTLAGKSNTNGAVMRISPLALIFHTTDTELYEQIKEVVYCTHGDNTDALDAAFVHVKLLKSIITETRKTAEELYSYALYLAAQKRNKTLYTALVAIGPDNKKQFLDNSWNITKTIYGFDLFQIEAIDCLVCALVCFLYNFNKPKEALLMAANNGGDTDTVAKLVGDLVGALHGTKWVPLEWQDIEGKLELVSLATTLYHRYNKTTNQNIKTINTTFESILPGFSVLSKLS